MNVKLSGRKHWSPKKIYALSFQNFQIIKQTELTIKLTDRQTDRDTDRAYQRRSTVSCNYTSTYGSFAGGDHFSNKFHMCLSFVINITVDYFRLLSSNYNAQLSIKQIEQNKHSLIPYQIETNLNFNNPEAENILGKG